MDRLTEMEVFATVVDQGGFTDAARKMGLSKSAISKHVSSLETRLGVRLLNRTTRRVAPTEIGLVYYGRARLVLAGAKEADALVDSLRAAPSGHLQLAASTDLGEAPLAAVVRGFMTAHPQVSLQLDLTARPPDPGEGGADLVLRLAVSGPDGTPGRRRIADTALLLVASPDYLSRAGHPTRIEDLTDHALLHHDGVGPSEGWRLLAPSGEARVVRTGPQLAVNDGRALLSAAISGLGIARLPAFLCSAALSEGRLQQLLPDLRPEVLSLEAQFVPDAAVQPRLRAFLDHLSRALQVPESAGWMPVTAP